MPEDRYPCPRCGTLNRRGAAYCDGCGSPLRSGVPVDGDRMAEEDSEPYVVWNRWPWTFLATVSRTREQYMAGLVIGGTILAMVTFYFFIVAWYLGVMFGSLYAIIAYLYWREGRKNARKMKRRKR